MTSAVAKLLSFASVAICLIVAASFVAFAVDRTSTASGQQQEILNPTTTATSSTPATQPSTASPSEASVEARTAKKPAAEDGFHRKLDEASEAFTSPVSGVTSSEWGSRALRLLFALLVYGFALGYVARVLRVRA